MGDSSLVRRCYSSEMILLALTVSTARSCSARRHPTLGALRSFDDVNENRAHRYPLGSRDAGDPPRLLPFLIRCGNPPLVESELALRNELYQGVYGLLRVVPFRPDGYLLVLFSS
jgi:hypothetical protein